MDAQSSASHVTPGAPHAGDAPEPEKKRRHLWIWAVVLILFGLLFYWVIQHHEATKAAAGGRHAFAGAVPVTTATATRGSMGVYLDALGTVTPVYTASISAQITGVVTDVHYREGQYVSKGQPLIDIDDSQYKAQLVAAQGALERDKQVLAQAQMDLERYQQAWAKNAIPRQTLEDQEKLVLQDQGTVKNDEGTVQYDQVQVDFCHITAPISGRVGLRLVDPGNLVTASSGTTLVVVAQTSPITVVFTLAEDSLPEVLKQLRGRQPLTVEVQDRAMSNHLATGKLNSLDNLIDTTTGTVKLRASFDNKDGALFPNEFVNTRLLVQTLQNQIIVPSSAIQHNGSQDFVYVLVNAKTKQPISDVSECSTPQSCKAKMQNVKSGHSEGNNTIVTSGLNEGEVVADSSFEKLIDGSPIVISKVQIPSTPETNAP
jgi:membrane fusion protein, multidrug efflux system